MTPATSGAPRAAVIGAGPAGFYTTDQLIAAGFEVDLYDALPTPFGLVRAGVAPDHPKIKSVIRVFEKTARKPGFRFFGGVALGPDISRAELLARYHAVVYAVGSSTDNRLGIPGEDHAGSHAATEFVAWYNGHPRYAGHGFDLSTRRAVVVGNGNVAIDVARMLVLDPGELAITDTADHALDALREASIEEVVLLGRRGPVQAAFTTPELKELGELARAEVVVDPAELELDEGSAATLAAEEEHSRVSRNMGLLREYAARGGGTKSHRIVLRFLRSPIEVHGDRDGRVREIEVVRNRLEPTPSGALRAIATEQRETIECGLLLRSIGYRGVALPEVPFDERLGRIRNVAGRVTDEHAQPLIGEYAVGWIKRGPSGVIGTNKKDATDTVARVLEDLEAGRLGAPTEPDPDAVEHLLRARVPELVDWNGWGAIDMHERTHGEMSGRPRVKLVSLEEMRRIAAGGG